MPVSWWH